MLALTSVPTTSVPSVRRHWWTMRSLIGFCTSRLRAPRHRRTGSRLIGELAAGLGVERRTVEDDLDVRGGADGRNRTLALLHDAEDAAASGHVGVAEEVDGLHERLLEVVVHAQVNVVALLQRIGTGAGLLLAHQLAELGLVDLDAWSAAISSVSSIGKP